MTTELFLPTIPTLITTIWVVFKEDNSLQISSSRVWKILSSILLIISSACIHISWSVAVWFGCLHAVLTYILAVAMIINKDQDTFQIAIAFMIPVFFLTISLAPKLSNELSAQQETDGMYNDNLNK